MNKFICLCGFRAIAAHPSGIVTASNAHQKAGCLPTEDPALAGERQDHE